MKKITVCIFLLVTSALAQDQKVDPVPPPPLVTQEVLYAKLGYCYVQQDMQSLYITSLQEKVRELSKQLEAAKAPKP